MPTPAADRFNTEHQRLSELVYGLSYHAARGINPVEFGKSMMTKLFVDDPTEREEAHKTSEQLMEHAFAGQRNTFFELIYCKLHDLFECYLCDAIAWAYHQRPAKLPGNKKLDFGFVRDYRSKGRSMDDLFEFMVQKETHDFIFGNLEDRRTYLRDRLNANVLVNQEERAKIRLLLAKRNLFVHNRGIVNLKFLHDTEDLDIPAEEGDQLICSAQDFFEVSEFLKTLVAAIDPVIEANNQVTQTAQPLTQS